MKNKYRVEVNGRNFLIEINGVVAKRGFYTNRYIEANDATEAEDLAMDAIRNRDDVRNGIKNTEDDPSMMYADEIYEIDSFKDVECFEEGFAWYMENESDEEKESEDVFDARITNRSKPTRRH